MAHGRARELAIMPAPPSAAEAEEVQRQWQQLLYTLTAAKKWCPRTRYIVPYAYMPPFTCILDQERTFHMHAVQRAHAPIMDAPMHGHGHHALIAPPATRLHCTHTCMHACIPARLQACMHAWWLVAVNKARWGLHRHLSIDAALMVWSHHRRRHAS